MAQLVHPSNPSGQSPIQERGPSIRLPSNDDDVQLAQTTEHNQRGRNRPHNFTAEGLQMIPIGTMAPNSTCPTQKASYTHARHLAQIAASHHVGLRNRWSGDKRWRGREAEKYAEAAETYAHFG